MEKIMPGELIKFLFWSCFYGRFVGVKEQKLFFWSWHIHYDDDNQNPAIFACILYESWNTFCNGQSLISCLAGDINMHKNWSVVIYVIYVKNDTEYFMSIETY